MVKQLKARSLLEGYRGAEPIDMDELTRMLVLFSQLVMDMEDSIESIDLNPVFAMPDGEGAFAVDAVIEIGD